MQERRLYAAFAGINAYPDSPLSGCIQDVLRVDRLLRSQCAAQEGLEYRPAYYLQPNNADLRLLEQYGTAAGAPLAWLPPTFENFTTRLFMHFAEAKAGDICVFFYSGHGSQTAAPPEFHFNNPSRTLQTIVCADSRTTARDLTNKEMAYLLWQAFGKTEAHCLVITDCCHSGGNTRALAPQGTEFRPRFHADAGKVLAFTDLLGHDAPGFYTNENGEMKPAIARYVHLAACRADELAQESWRGGVFTGRLMEALLANGGTASYRDLMWRMQTVVTAAAGQQHPVAFAATEADLDRRFLSDAMQPVVPSFDVLFDVALNRWKIFGGMLHGLTPGALLDIREGDFRLEAELREVEALFSLIDIPGLDTTSETAKATMIRAAAPALLIASPPDAALEQALAAGTFPLLNVGFGEEAGYEVFRPADGSYVLLEKNGTLPLFRRTASAAVFLSYAQRVAAWMAALDWKRLDPRLGRGHFELQWTAIEGFGSSERALHTDNDTIELKYKNGESPAFRLGIALKADAPVERCFVRVLYLGSKYDIFTELIRDGEPALERGGAPLYLTYIDNGKTVSAIPVSIDELYPGYNRYEISDYLKIIVSAADFRVGRFAQEALELDRPGSRGIGGVRSGAEKEIGEAVSWSVFHCRICTAFEGLEKSAGPGGEVLLGPLAITTPAGFSGKLALLPERQAEVVGPDAWGDVPSENALDGGMAALRLEMAEPLRPEDPLFLLQAPPKAAVRALPDHAVIPFVTAAGGKAYEPAGFQDAAGRIQVFHAPASDVYFRRIYLSPQPTRLRIFTRTGGSWQPSAYDPAKPAALLLDGITGDSSFMWQVFSARPDAPEQLLRFDFSPAHDITVAADALEAALAAAGAGDVHVVTNGIGKQLAQLAELTDAGKLIFSGKEGEGRASGDLLRMLAFALRENGPVKAAVPALAAALRLHGSHRPETVSGGSYPAYLLDENEVTSIIQHIIPH